MTKRERPAYLRALADPQAPAQSTLPGIDPAPRAEPAKPADLEEKAAVIWDELYEQLPDEARANLNHTLFQTYVNATMHYRAAEAEVRKYGAVIKSPSGYPIQSPFLSVRNAMAKEIRQTAAQLGITHKARNGSKGKGSKSGGSNPFTGLRTID